MKLRCSECNEELVGKIAPDSPNSIGIMVIEVQTCVNCLAKERLKVVDGAKKKLKDG